MVKKDFESSAEEAIQNINLLEKKIPYLKSVLSNIADKSLFPLAVRLDIKKGKKEFEEVLELFMSLSNKINKDAKNAINKIAYEQWIEFKLFKTNKNQSPLIPPFIRKK